MDCLVTLSHLRDLDVSATLLFPGESSMELADIRTLLPASLEKIRFDETELGNWDVWCIQWGKPWGVQTGIEENLARSGMGESRETTQTAYGGGCDMPRKKSRAFYR